MNGCRSHDEPSVTRSRTLSALTSGRRHAGFALVATLLLAFLVISLLVALMTVATVESRIVTNQMKLYRARSHALHGVSAAMWRLNDYNGLDWRATATAGMLDSDPTTPELDGIENPWLAGVWPGRGKTAAEQHEKPITWLISGAKEYPSRAPELNTQDPESDPDDKKEPITPQTKLPDPKPDNDMIWLLRHPVGDDGKLSVKARKVDLITYRPFRSADPKQKYVMGHYAWWAADEGVKARANLTVPDFDKQTAPPDDAQTVAQWRLAAPQRGISLMDGFEKMPDDPAKLAKVLTFAQIPLMEGDSGGSISNALQKHWHDITADSLSLVTNSRDGGVKIDLSMFCEMTAEDREKYAPKLTSELAAIIDYYQAYKRVQNRATQPTLEAQPFATKPPDKTKASLANAANTWLNTVSAGIASEPSKCLFSPLVVRMSYAFSVQAQNAPPLEADGPDRKLVLVLDPIITLWNPHNVVLELDAYRVDAALPTMHIVVEKREPWKTQRLYRPGDEVWFNGVLYRAAVPSIGAEPGSEPDPEAPKKWVPAGRDWSLASDIQAAEVLLNHGPSSRPHFLLLQKKDNPQTKLSLKPGEFVTFSLNADAVTPQQGSFTLALEPGFNAGGGVSFDRLADDRHPQRTPDQLLRVFADSEVRITLEPARDPSYAGTDPFSFVKNYQNDGLLGEDASFTPQAWRESIGYRSGGGGSLSDYDWAGVRTGRGAEFSHRLRAYTGKDGNDHPLPGTSAALKIGTDITDSAKKFLGVIDWQMKSAADTTFPVPMMSHFDPRALIVRNPGKGYPATLSQYQIKARVVASGDDVIGTTRPLIGTGQGSAPVFAVPTAPLLSIGQLQHFPMQAGAPWIPGWPGYALGSSWPSPWLSLTGNAGSTSSGFDFSHSVNDTMFDRYFFSSISPRPDEDTVNGRLADWLSPKISKPLPNPRMKFLLDYGDRRQDLLSNLTRPLDPKTNTVPTFLRVAANLFVEGAFNVNSTSVEAWKAVLGSLRQSKLPTFDAATLSTSLASSAADVPLPRMTLVNGPANTPQDWTSYRSLSSAEIERLAQEIVREVKTRGPFSSLSDFINRRLEDDATGKKGALQAAIDRSGINKNYSADQITRQQLDEAASLGKAAGMDWSFPYPDNLVGETAAASPGYLTQGDVLQALAPHLVTRSDTYKIRSYGDLVNPVTGRLEARAWVEVIVQRTPDFVNYRNKDEPPEEFKPDPNWQQTHLLRNVSNRVYGRRWRVVRVRWLSPEEV